MQPILLDQGLWYLHLIIIGINVLGWILPATRRLQRGILLLTALSWLGLGLFRGIGYCFLTDWHWRVKRQLGETEIPSSFIQYILRNKLGFAFTDFSVDVVTGSVFAAVLLITLGQIWQEHRHKKS